MKIRPFHQDAVARLAAVDPNWEYWNVLRLKPVRKEHGYPVVARAYHGPFIEKENGKVIGLQLAYNYVGLVKGWYRFIVHEDDFHPLKRGIIDNGIEIESSNSTACAVCPWWLNVTLWIRHVPSDRFITADGRVIYYDDLAEQLELDLWSNKR